MEEVNVFFIKVVFFQITSQALQLFGLGEFIIKNTSGCKIYQLKVK